ncbi:MAG: hypothetical protein HQL31_08505 [Planctomycetes bacterium]|nr:hypothetical protein [Planctomycetota bacterium]
MRASISVRMAFSFALLALFILPAFCQLEEITIEGIQRPALFDLNLSEKTVMVVNDYTIPPGKTFQITGGGGAIKAKVLKTVKGEVVYAPGQVYGGHSGSTTWAIFYIDGGTLTIGKPAAKSEKPVAYGADSTDTAPSDRTYFSINNHWIHRYKSKSRTIIRNTDFTGDWSPKGEVDVRDSFISAAVHLGDDVSGSFKNCYFGSGARMYDANGTSINRNWGGAVNCKGSGADVGSRIKFENCVFLGDISLTVNMLYAMKACDLYGHHFVFRHLDWSDGRRMDAYANYCHILDYPDYLDAAFGSSSITALDGFVAPRADTPFNSTAGSLEANITAVGARRTMMGKTQIEAPEMLKPQQ